MNRSPQVSRRGPGGGARYFRAAAVLARKLAPLRDPKAIRPLARRWFAAVQRALEDGVSDVQ